MSRHLTYVALLGVSCIAAPAAWGAELQQPVVLTTPSLSAGPTPGSTSPPGSSTTCAPLPPPVNGIVPGQLVVRDGISPDVGPYAVRLPGYSTGLGAANRQRYRPFLFQAQPGASLRFDVVNQLDPGTPEDETNIHTHGLVVAPRPCTLLGDYIFVTDEPKTTTSYRIDVPRTLPGNMFASQAAPRAYPSGLYWIHGHLHAYTSDELLAGQSAFIYVGNLIADLLAAPNLDAATASKLRNVDTVYMALRDIQLAVPRGATPDKALPGQSAQWLSGNDYMSTACLSAANPPIPIPGQFAGPGYCGHHAVSRNGKVDPAQDTVWMFTINGQYNPTVTMRPGRDGDWRITNFSPNATYLIELDDDATGRPEPITALAYDGFTAGSNAPGSTGLNVGVPQQRLLLTPGNRIEVYVPNTGGPKGRRLTLRTLGLTTGASGDPWPRIDIARVVMPPGPLAPPAGTKPINVTLPSAAPSLLPNPRSATDGAVPVNCAILPAGQSVHRLITFADGPAEGEYTLSSQVVDRFDRPVDPQYTIPARPFEMRAMTAPNIVPHVCIKSGEQEVWEVLNASGEMHNFHIHQTKFRLSRPGDSGAPVMLTDSMASAYIDPTGQFSPEIAELTSTAGKKVDIWRDVIALPPYGGRIFVTIPFYAPQQVGDFVYHCHILKHEEGGMMAVVQVYKP